MTDERKPTIIKSFPGQAVERQLRATGALPGEICYTEMQPSHVLIALGDDAEKWATAFCQHARQLGIPDIDPGWMVGWFANAIEHSSDVRRWRKEGRDIPVSLDS